MRVQNNPINGTVSHQTQTLFASSGNLTMITQSKTRNFVSESKNYTNLEKKEKKRSYFLFASLIRDAILFRNSCSELEASIVDIIFFPNASTVASAPLSIISP
jgi:hypothetical protein